MMRSLKVDSRFRGNDEAGVCGNDVVGFRGDDGVSVGGEDVVGVRDAWLLACCLSAYACRGRLRGSREVTA